MSTIIFPGDQIVWWAYTRGKLIFVGGGRAYIRENFCVSKFLHLLFLSRDRKM